MNVRGGSDVSGSSGGAAQSDATEGPTAGQRIRVALCDDHQVLRESVEIAIGRDPRFEVVGSWSGGEELLAGWDPDATDLLVVDISLPPMGGVALIGQAVRRCPDVKVLVLSANEDPRVVRDALEAGARGYLLKTTEIRSLKDTMVAVAAGLQILDPDLDLREGRTELTGRQLEILELLARGMSRQEVADELILTVNTVKHHLQTMYGVMGVHNALEAVARGRELGWLAADDPVLQQ